MTGGDDPDCRKPLWWPEYEFEPEFRNNLQEGQKTYDEVGFDPDHFEFYRQIIRLRKENPVLVDGDFEFLLADGKMLSYRRTNGSDEIIVLFNLEQEEMEFTLPQGSSYINLLDNTGVSGTVTIGSLQAAVCKRIGS